MDINKTDFVEAHGTGTPVGDPLEAEGIAQAFTIGNKERKQPLTVGSSKSNFGHMEGAAGMVQAIKAALMLENRKIYKNINFGEPNPAMSLVLIDTYKKLMLIHSKSYWQHHPPKDYQCLC